MITGLFFPVSSLFGLPLEEVVYRLSKENMVVDWIDFYEDAIKNGWHPERTINKIVVSVEETFGKEYSMEVRKRLEYINRRMRSATQKLSFT